MNKIDFKNIKNELNSNIDLLNDNEVFNKGIFSFVYHLDNFKIDNFMINPIFDLNPIIFSDPNSRFLAFKEEKKFKFSNSKELKLIESKILNLIKNTFFINKVDKNEKTFIFGGHTFSLDSKNDGIWSNLPKGNFVLPRYIFLNSYLIINFFSSSKINVSNIQLALNNYISELQKLIKEEDLAICNKLNKISDYTDKSIYVNHLDQMINDLNDKDSNLDKVVLSRIKKASFKQKISKINVFNKLLKNNKDTMNFLYSINSNACMIGSTPELILSLDKNKITSESLAGSNYNTTDEDFSSNQKEIIEQKIVTEYIIDVLENNATNIKYNKKPFIKKTSNIDHLCTSISGIVNNKKNIFELLNLLHPTPAISGFPIKDAIDKINLMKENRGWYGGPIGWIDNNLNGKFFLNIRSGLILDKDIYLFSGSGITKDSNLDDEWNETEQKFNLMIDSI